MQLDGKTRAKPKTRTKPKTRAKAAPAKKKRKVAFTY